MDTPELQEYSISIMKTSLKSLRKLNIVAGIFHLVLAAVVLAFSNDFTLPVTASYLAGPPGSFFTDSITLLDIRTGYAVALFLGLSSLFHFIVASRSFFARYEKGLKKNTNIFRWVEYSFSSSLMIFLIAQITGISDYGALIGIIGVNAAMILFGWLQERYVKPGSGDWLPFIFGCIAGIVPWIIVLISVLSPGSPSDAMPPAFVYGITAQAVPGERQMERLLARRARLYRTELCCQGCVGDADIREYLDLSGAALLMTKTRPTISA
jgi:hypothetical protein